MQRLIVSSWLVVFGCLAGLFVASFVLTGDYLLFDYVALIPQWLYGFPLLFLCLSLPLVWRGWQVRLMLGAGMVALVVMWVVMVDVVLDNRNALGVRPAIKLVSWNTAVWNSARKAELVRELQRHDADIYLLQEVHYSKNRKLHGEITNQYFPGYQAGHYGEYFTLSRFPLSCDTPDRSGAFLACRALIDGAYVSLVNVHLRRPFYVTNFETFDDFGTRWEQFRALEWYLGNSRYPTVIAGDFNSTSHYPFMRQLRKNYQMNNPTGLLVFPHTFPTDFPYMRIDYQFSSDAYRFCGYQEIKRPDLSDHVGIVGSLCTPI